MPTPKWNLTLWFRGEDDVHMLESCTIEAETALLAAKVLAARWHIDDHLWMSTARNEGKTTYIIRNETIKE